MNSTTQQVLRHFLGVLHKQMHTDKSENVSSFFERFFLTEELRAIVRWIFPDDLSEDELHAFKRYELLDAIGGDHHILGYYLKQWDDERKAHERPTAQAVWKTLKQLGHPTHYLATKGLDQWDEYDVSNYSSLQTKAGNLRKVYGIYASSIMQADVETVTSPPNRYYDTEEDAQEAIEELLALNNFFRRKELAVRYTFKGA